jgi:hypothetical protein
MNRGSAHAGWRCRERGGTVMKAAVLIRGGAGVKAVVLIWGGAVMNAAAVS